MINCYRLGYISDLISALRVVAQRIIQSKRPALINLSLLSGHSRYIDGAMVTLYSWGIPIVVGAGNRSDACNYSPANSKYVLTVAGSSVGDTPYWNTNLGKCVDIFAPAVNVLGASVHCNHCTNTSTPNYPRHHLNNLHCTWRIIAPPGKIIRITIEELNLAQNDTVIIYDGNSTDLTSSIVLAELTGKTIVEKTL